MRMIHSKQDRQRMKSEIRVVKAKACNGIFRTTKCQITPSLFRHHCPAHSNPGGSMDRDGIKMRCISTFELTDCGQASLRLYLLCTEQVATSRSLLRSHVWCWCSTFRMHAIPSSASSARGIFSKAKSQPTALQYKQHHGFIFPSKSN
jgi:hypothetical protein